MKNILTASVAAMLLMLPGLAGSAHEDARWVEMDGVTVPVPPAEHPRLYVRSSDIPELRERLEDPRVKEIIRKMEKLSVPRTPEEEAKATDRGFRYYFNMRGITSEVQLQALDYLVNGDRKEARKAITSFLDTLKRTNFGTTQDLSRASGVMLMCGAMIYDWCYDQMSDKEKQAYIKEFIRIAGTMECHYPPKNTEPIAGHSSEWMVLRDMLSAGIAIYDEYPDMYNHVITMLFRDYIPARDFIYSGHNYHQGTSYANVRFSNDLISLWILDRMGAGNVYNPAQQFVLYDFIYRRRPDGQVLPAGDENPGRRTPASYSLPAMFASSYYKDGYLAYEFERTRKVENHCLMLEILWRDFDIEPLSPETLPLTRYSGTPFGWMIARTGWDENSVIAEMKVNEHYVGNHQHLDAGSFQIYYKGPLAIDAGTYQGTSGGYNSPHNKNFFKRTIAHNSLLIYDPEEKFACWNYGGGDKTEFAANDGGQRMPGDRWDTCRSFEDLKGESYTVGKVMAKDFGPSMQTPEYTYLKGDITDAYSAKVKEVKRSFVFLNLEADGQSSADTETSGERIPAALIVFDRTVSANPDFRKYWLLHSIEEPAVDGNTFTLDRTLNGDSGRLFDTVLLPTADNLEISKVGGPGKEFYVFGTNYPNEPRRPDPANERGAWRVELSPKSPSETDLFLNVIQVTDNSCNDLYKVRTVTGERVGGGKTVSVRTANGDAMFCGPGEWDGTSPVTGAWVKDRVVTFSTDSCPLGGSFSIDLTGTDGNAAAESGNPSLKILLTDLLPGTWQVFKDGQIFIPGYDVREGEGTMYFEGPEGRYEFRR